MIMIIIPPSSYMFRFNKETGKRMLMQKSICFCCPMLLIVIVLLASFPMNVSAKETDRFLDNSDFLQQYEYRAKDNLLRIFLAPIEDGTLEKDYYRVELDADPVIELPVMSIEDAGKEPVTYYCLVDNTLQNNEVIEFEKAVLGTICDQMSGEDQMIVAPLSQLQDSGNVLNNKEQLNKQIEALAFQESDEGLYKGIIEGISRIDSNTELNVHKCMIILSNGVDNTKDGQIRPEVKRQILKAKLPVFSVCMIQSEDANNGNGLDEAKILGSFALQSPGGQSYFPFLDSLEADHVAKSIVGDIKKSAVVSVDTSGLRSQKRNWRLFATYKTPDGSLYGDKMRVYFESATDENRWVFYLVPVAVLALGAVFFYLYRRKKISDGNDGKINEESVGSETNVDNAAFMNDQIMLPGAITPYEGETVSNVPMNTRKLLFTVVGHDHHAYTVEIIEGKRMTLGRNQKSDVVLNPDDRKLSGVHLYIIFVDHVLRVKDAGSKNGTSVNGIPLVEGQEVTIENGQILQVGSYEYRVQFI